jgi:putative inorganic carbon (HCO3(-)) transporter
MAVLFNLLSFLLPLALYTHTSELFEFNKIILLYSFTAIIAGYWLILMIAKRKIIFRRTILDIPLLLFLASQLVSTILSIDMRTSFLGYYSRFNGGLISLICYALLYWVYVSFMTHKDTLKLLRTVVVSAVLVSIYGSLEHFGHSPSCLVITKSFDVSCWVQDVQLRVFATLGQPNWLGAWLAAIIPLSWLLAEKKKNLTYQLLNVLFFSALLFTKSRSAILGLAVGYVIYWAGNFWLKKKRIKIYLKQFIPITFFFLVLTLLIGSPWTPSLNEIISKNQAEKPQINSLEQDIVPSIQRGGTESGDIRKIVWTGAWDLFKLYPIFGSGVETFGLAYYQTRPAAHNNVSEWNFLYNKAHNEYLNFLSTTGIFGFSAYILVLAAALLTFVNLRSLKKTQLALLASFSTILVSNFFGFSVVPVSFLTFILPAMAISTRNNKTNKLKTLDLQQLDSQQKIAGLVVLGLTLYILWQIASYWYADTLYAKADSYSKAGDQQQAQDYVDQAISLTPNEAVYHNLLADIFFKSAQVAYGAGESDKANSLVAQMSVELDKAHELSPRNIKLIKSAANMYSNISNYNAQYLPATIKYLEILEQFAPTDASVYYIKALTMARLGQKDEAFRLIEKTLELRPKYKNARLLYAVLLAEDEQKDKAREQIKYVNTYISPDDKEASVVAEEYGL